MTKLVLVVDDEQDVLDVVSFRLKKAGYEVAVAENGKIGLEAVKQKKPDLILLDLRMPEMGGPEVCKIIKADQSLKSIPVIFLTASQVGHVAEKVKEYGANDYLTKPFFTDDLLKKVQQYI